MTPSLLNHGLLKLKYSYVRSSFAYHPKIVRAVQNYSCQDWDAVGVPELEGGAKGVL